MDRISSLSCEERLFAALEELEGPRPGHLGRAAVIGSVVVLLGALMITCHAWTAIFVYIFTVVTLALFSLSRYGLALTHAYRRRKIFKHYHLCRKCESDQHEGPCK